jgi:hypothetical protein
VVSVNLIFHIVSAFTFIVLIWYLLHLQSQIAFVRDLTNSVTSLRPKLKVDWPEAFLKRYADAYGIEFKVKESPNASPKPAPQKIDLKLWAELHQSLGVESIEWALPQCRLKVRRNIELNAWRMRLEATFQGKILIEWSTASSMDV